MDFFQRFMVVHKFAAHRRTARGRLVFHGLAGERGEKAGVNGHQALATRIHHARGLEHGEHIGRLFQNGVARREERAEQIHHIVGFLHLAIDVVRRNACHGEDRALFGLHNRLIGHLRARAQRLGEQIGVHFLRAFQALGKAAQNLAEDHARIAARAAQRALGRAIRHFVHAGERAVAQVFHGGIHGLAHIGSRIAIRHGEHVQRVDAFTVGVDVRSAGKEHLFQHQPVYRFHFVLRNCAFIRGYPRSKR